MLLIDALVALGHKMVGNQDIGDNKLRAIKQHLLLGKSVTRNILLWAMLAGSRIPIWGAVNAVRLGDILKEVGYFSSAIRYYKIARNQDLSSHLVVSKLSRAFLDLKLHDQAKQLIVDHANNYPEYYASDPWLTYDVYGACLRSKCEKENTNLFADVDFDRLGFKLGVFNESTLKKLNSLFEAGQRSQIYWKDCSDDYVTYPEMKDLQQDINRDYGFVVFSESQRAEMGLLFSELVPILERCMQMHWKIVNVKGWVSYPKNPGEVPAMNRLHYDGFPKLCRKILIYLGGADQIHGTTEMHYPDGRVCAIEGPPGTWVFFKNSEILHRGVAPKAGERRLIEITIAPAEHSSQLPAFGGLNSYYPIVPWPSLH